jgi:peroxiredoxin
LVGLRDLARTFPDVKIYGISRDYPKDSRELETKIASDGRGPLNFALLSDPRSVTIDRYALRDPNYRGEESDGVPRPSVFVLDAEGRVRWSKIESDYRERPTTEEVAAALDSFD